MSVESMLFDYQKNILDIVKDKKSYGLFLDCGIGKTPLGVALAEYHQCDKVIIITINSKATESVNLPGSWLWWSSKSSLNHEFLDKKFLKSSSPIPSSATLILNYESLYERGKNTKSKVTLRERIVEFIKSCRGQRVCLLIDESHKMKDTSSMQSMAISKIKAGLEAVTDYVWSYLMTGTPFSQGFLDVYAQLKFLGWNGTKQLFKDTFCVLGHIGGLAGWQQPVIGYKNIDQLYRLIHLYALTIKSNVLQDLPEQIFQIHLLPESSSFRFFTKEKVKGKDILKEFDRREITPDILEANHLDYSSFQTSKKVNNPFYANIDFPSLDFFSDTLGARWMRSRQLSIGFVGNEDEYIWFNDERIKLLEEFLTNNENNYIIFYNYNPELYAIYDVCERLGYNIDVYCGEIKTTEFYEKYASESPEKQLQNQKNVIISNFVSGSTGKNWQAYNQCIIFSLPVYRDWEQAIKRIHRTGQNKTCFYHIFMQDNFLDNGMKKALDSNSEYTKEMFDTDQRKESLKDE